MWSDMVVKLVLKESYGDFIVCTQSAKRGWAGGMLQGTVRVEKRVENFKILPYLKFRGY